MEGKNYELATDQELVDALADEAYEWGKKTVPGDVTGDRSIMMLASAQKIKVAMIKRILIERLKREKNEEKKEGAE